MNSRAGNIFGIGLLMLSALKEPCTAMIDSPPFLYTIVEYLK